MKTSASQGRDKLFVDLKHWFAARQYNPARAILCRPFLRRCLSEFVRCIKHAATVSIGTPEVGVAPCGATSACILSVLFSSRPKIATRETNEDRSGSGQASFALQGQKHFFDSVTHNDQRASRRNSISGPHLAMSRALARS